MDEPSANEKVVNRLIGCINDRRVEIMDELFHDDAVMHWPQSGELVRGAENRRGIYNAFPQLPTITPRRLTSGGNLVVAEALLDYGGPSMKRYSSSNSGMAGSPGKRPTGVSRSMHRNGAPSGLKRPSVGDRHGR